MERERLEKEKQAARREWEGWRCQRAVVVEGREREGREGEEEQCYRCLASKLLKGVSNPNTELFCCLLNGIVNRQCRRKRGRYNMLCDITILSGTGILHPEDYESS